jgi:predicted enzyme related to lactoylglutathione lyase
MPTTKDYPAGVPCWIDLIQDDGPASEAFYAGLFGWEYDVKTPSDAPFRYAYSRLADGIVGGIGSPIGPHDSPGWKQYVSVESADDTAAAVEANGGTVESAPMDLGTSGRVAHCADAQGARFGIWQPAELLGSEVVNAAGSWNFSELNTDDPDAAVRFYGAVFGWELKPWFPGGDSTAGFFTNPGYGEHLMERYPSMREFIESDAGPAGFGDAVAILQPQAGAPSPWWSTTFGVADADASFARAVELGAEVVSEPVDTPYTRQSTIRDPQGAALNLSEYRPG